MKGNAFLLRLYCSAFAVMTSLHTQSHAQDRDDVLAGIRKRLSSLQTIAVEFRYEIATFPDEEGLALDGVKIGAGTLRVVQGSAKGSGRFYRDGAQWQYDMAAVEDPSVGAALGWVRSVYSQSANRFERLTIEPGDSRPRGLIQDGARLPETEYLDVGLGLRRLEGHTWWTDEDLAEFVLAGNSAGTAVVEFRTSAGHLHRLGFDPERQFALVSYEGFSRERAPFVIGTFGEFKDSDGLAWPSRIRWDFFHRDGTVYQSFHYQVVSVSRDPPASFLIEWPLQSSVLDQRTGANIGIRSAPQVLSDAKLKRASEHFKKEFPEFTSPPAPSDSSARKGSLGTWLIFANGAVLLSACAVLAYRKYWRV